MADLIPISESSVGTTLSDGVVSISDDSLGYKSYIAYGTVLSDSAQGSLYGNMVPISYPAVYGYATSAAFPVSASAGVGELTLSGYDATPSTIYPISASVDTGELIIIGYDATTNVIVNVCFQPDPNGNFSDFSRGKNSYFNYKNSEYNAEKSLMGLLVTEAYNKHGVCMEYYIATYDKRYDRIWGEDNDRRFERYFDTMVYFQLPREEKMWTKFGIEGTDNFSMWVSKRHFRAASNNPITRQQYIPKMGDVIRSKYNNYFYEIVEIKEDTGLWLQSKQHMWEFVVRVFKDEHISLTSETSASAISALTDKDRDIFDIKNVVDVEKEDVVYKPKPSEKPSNDPFGNW